MTQVSFAAPRTIAFVVGEDRAVTTDRDADFSAFAAARWTALVRSGVVLGCSLEDAEDLAQNALLKCYGSWRRVQRADDRDAYVYTVLLNCYRDSKRRRWWGEQPTEELPDRGVADRTEEVAATDTVRRALESLGPEQREVVVLRHLAQLSERQTAEVLGIAPGTVKSRLSRALAQLATSPHLVNGRRP